MRTILSTSAAMATLAAIGRMPPLEIKEAPDPIEEIKSAFAGYHGEVKSVVDKLGKLEDEFQKMSKHSDDIEMRMNHMRLSGLGGADGGGNARELREIGEAFRVYIKSGNTAGLSDLLTRDMSVGSDPEGGFSVYPTVSAMLTKRVFETSPLRPLCRVVTIGTDAFEELLDLYEADAGWVGEKSPRTGTDTPDLGKLRIPVREIYAMPKVTQQLLDDSSIDIGSWLVDKVASKFQRMETAAFFTGNGTSQPRGFLTYDTTAEKDAIRAWGKLQHVVTGVANNIHDSTHNGFDALIDLQSSLKADYRTNAVWQMNRATAAVISKIKDENKNFIWQRAQTAGQPDMLLGHPVVLAEDMPDIGADAYPVAFGDFRSGYTIVDRHGDRLLRDPYTDKPNVRFYMYRRVGGDVNNFEAIKLLKCST